MGFEKGCSIVHNASMHAGQAVVVRLDLKDFFPSIREERVRAYFRFIGWDEEAAGLPDQNGASVMERSCQKCLRTDPRWELRHLLCPFCRRVSFLR